MFSSPLYTPEEVANKLKVKRQTVYTWLRTGEIAGARAGHGWRISEDDMIAFMKAQQPKKQQQQ